MKITQIDNREELNNFVGKQKHSQFLQSWEWGEFQARIGFKVFRLGVVDREKIIAVATLIKRDLPMGRSYFYCPRGPVVQISDFRFQISDLFDEIKKIAEDDKIIFLRYEPQSAIENLKSQITKTLDVQPSQTLVLDLGKSEEELLSAMHQKTRYNIRLAEKKGVKIVDLPAQARGGGERFEEFWQIMEETNKRDGFRLHSKDYYQKMLEDNKEIPNDKSQITKKFQNPNSKLHIKLFLAIYKKKVVTGNIVSFFGDMATYMHGASSYRYRNVMAPYALQWHCIKLAKKLGHQYYDFYGIDEKKWPGVSRFKKGFGGETQEYPGTFDLVFSKGWYIVYKLLRRIRRIF